MVDKTVVTFQLPELPYSYDALEPHMSRETLEYHHGKHHQAYVDKADALLKESPLTGTSIESLIKAAYTMPESRGLFNNAAQHYNHELFWKWMRPQGGGSLPGGLETVLSGQFGSVDAFKNQFNDMGVSQFGSGWVWLAKRGEQLEIMSTPNGENPLVRDAQPILGCDVWEHSYYLDHRNDRGAYIDTFLENLVNWEFVAELYDQGG